MIVNQLQMHKMAKLGKSSPLDCLMEKFAGPKHLVTKVHQPKQKFKLM